MAIKISGSTIIDDGRSLVNVGVSTISGNLHVGCLLYTSDAADE